MQDLKNYMDIPGLIVKEIHGEISPVEKERLEGWMNESPENRELHDRLRRGEVYSGREDVVRKLHKQVAWKRVDRMTGGRRISPMARVMKYVAAVVIPLVSVVLAFYFFGKEQPQQVATTKPIVEIKPGEMKAELILAGGNKMFLTANLSDSLTNEEGVNIVKDGEGISYQGGENVEALVYNTLRVPRGGEFKIKLQDGTIVHVNSGTVLRYPVKFVGEERRVYLSGEAYFDVQRDESKPFVVEMAESEIKVLGTEFNARAYPEEKRQLTTLVSGKVALTSQSGKSVELTPGEQGEVEGTNVKKEKIDVYIYTAWKDGKFVFRKQRLEDIMNIVERWYDVKVVFVDEGCKDVTFSGNVLRYDGFNKLVEMLEVTGSVKFQIKDNVIYITKNR